MSWSESTAGLHYCDLYDDDSDLMDCGTIHEDTVRDCGYKLLTVIPRTD